MKVAPTWSNFVKFEQTCKISEKCCVLQNHERYGVQSPDRRTRDRRTRDRETRDRETRDRETRDRETRDSQTRDSET